MKKVIRLISFLTMIIATLTISSLTTYAATQYHYRTKMDYLTELNNYESSSHMIETMYHMEAYGNATAVDLAKFAFTRWDEELNDIYQNIKAYLSDTEKATLKADELNWIKDKERIAQSILDSTGSLLEYYNYLLETTKNRCYYLVNIYA